MSGFFADPWDVDDPSQPQSFFGNELRNAARWQSAGWGNPLLSLVRQPSYPGSLAPPGAIFANGAVAAPLAYAVRQPRDDVPRDALAQSPEQVAAIGDNPPAPPGYDPNTWKASQWDNGRAVLIDPEGKTYTVHPEDPWHWRHWDINGSGGDDQGSWPPGNVGCG